VLAKQSLWVKVVLALGVLGLVLPLTLTATPSTSQIAKLFIIGFEGEKIPKKLASFIRANGIGGVILFQKNIKNPQQLKALTSSIQNLSTSPIMIATDQEGGLVERLSTKNGFYHTLKPIEVAGKGDVYAKRVYAKMAKTLAQEGINTNFAPCVDLAINPDNQVISKYGRAFSDKSETVVHFAKLFMAAMQKEGILSVVKHFPGHGSSLGDSHQGFVDVSDLWQKEELTPFIQTAPKAVMSAHIFNRHIDAKYPATLSKKSLGMLREKGFEGVIVSDDLQMRAISKNFDLNTTLTLALNGGVDMLLFGNQLAQPIMIETLVSRVKALVAAGKIKKQQIEQATQRIDTIKKDLNARR
jgi:beta-N-acetylhexosaminidase